MLGAVGIEVGRPKPPEAAIRKTAQRLLADSMLRPIHPIAACPTQPNITSSRIRPRAPNKTKQGSIEGVGGVWLEVVLGCMIFRASHPQSGQV